MLLQGKSALIIDGNDLINQTIARYLSYSGASVIITDKALNTEQSNYHFPCLQADFSRQRIMRNCYAALATLKIDILIIQEATLISHFSNKVDFNKNKSVNDIIELLIDKMSKQQFGRIVMIKNQTNIKTLDKKINQSWGKLQFILKKAPCLFKKGVLINGISTHLLATTELQKKLTIQESETILDKTIMGRFVLPEDLAKCATWLASADNSFLSGEQLRLDGGYGHVL